MTTMRAKVRISGIEKHENTGHDRLDFVFPAKDGPYPSDGSDEDQSFASYTPSASLSMTIANPNLIGRFSVGDTFYIDFSPADE